jgi:hypothetical protein
MSRLRFALPGLFISSLLASAGLSAQSADTVSIERARSVPALTVYFENDVFAHTDCHYTNGVKLSWLSDLTNWGQTGCRTFRAFSLPMK